MAVKRFLKRTTMRKAAQTAATFLALFVGGMATVEIPQDPSALDKALPAIGIAVVGAAWRAWRNMKKNATLPGNPLGNGNVYSGYVLAVAGLAGLLSGCITTTAPDGTTTTQVDGVLLETMLTRYDRYVARQELLEIEREKARRADDAAMLAIVQAELDKLEPEIRRLAERLGLAE